MGGARRLRVRLSAGEALRDGRPHLQPHLGAHPGNRRVPVEPDGTHLRRDLRLVAHQGRPQGERSLGARVPEGTRLQVQSRRIRHPRRVHEAKPELHCVVHTHSLAGMAVASLKKGLLPMTQTAMRFARVAYHDYEGVVLDMGERERLLENLGDCDVMLLRNHGTLAVGRTVAEGFNNAYRLQHACRTQLLAQACNDEVLLPSQEVFEKTSRMYRPEVRRPMGVLEWPAMRRLADRLDPSYKN